MDPETGIGNALAGFGIKVFYRKLPNLAISILKMI